MRIFRVGHILPCCLYIFCYATRRFAQDGQISISRAALMLDDNTPHMALALQMVTPTPDRKDDATIVESGALRVDWRYFLTLDLN